MLEYKHYLQSQFESIQSKLLGDQSVLIFRDLDNKEFLHRRVNEIFEKTYNSEREHYIRTLIADINSLRAQVLTLGGTLASTQQTPSQQPAHHSQNQREEIQKSQIIKQSQGFKAQLAKSRLQFESERDRLQNQILRLQEDRKNGDLRQSSMANQWKQKESRLMDSFREFIEENKQLQTEIVDLRTQLDSWRLRETASHSDSQNYRKKHKDLEVQNKQLITTLSSNLNQIQTLYSTNNKLSKELGVLQSKTKSLQDEKSRLQSQVVSLGDTREQQISSKCQSFQLECQAKGSLVKKLQTSLCALNRQLEQKNQEVLVWKQNYEASLSQNNSQKVKLAYETQLVQLRNQLVLAQNDYQKQLQKSSERTNTIMKEEVTTMENNKLKDRTEYTAKIGVLNKQRQELEELARLLGKEKDQLESSYKAELADLGREGDRLTRENQTMKSNGSIKQAQHKTQVNNYQEHICSLKRALSEEADKHSQLELLMVVSRRQQKERADTLERELERNKALQVLLIKKDLSIKESLKQAELAQTRHRDLQCKLTISDQQNAEASSRLAEERCSRQLLSSEVSRLRVSLCKSEQELNHLEVRHRVQVKQMVDRHMQQLQHAKTETTLQVQQQAKVLRQVAITQQHALQVQQKCQRAQIDRVYQLNTNLKKERGQHIAQIKELSETLQAIEAEIGYIRQEEKTRSAEAKQTALLLKEENQDLLREMTACKSQNCMYRSRMSQFKQETVVVVKGILKMVWDDLLSIKQETAIMQKQYRHSIADNLLQFTEKLKHHSSLASSKLREAYCEDYNDLVENSSKQASVLRDEWEAKCRKLQLDLMAVDAQRQLEKAETAKRIKMKQGELETQRLDYDDLVVRKQELQSACSQYPQVIRKLQEKNKQLAGLVDICRQEESKLKAKLQREQERARKSEAQCESKLESYRHKYSQDNEELFNRYEKSLQQMVTKTTLGESQECLEDTLSFNKSPVRKQTSIAHLRQQISHQRTRLKQLGGR